MQAYVSPEGLTNHLDARVGHSILAQVNRAQLLLHLDALRQGLNQLVIEVVLSEVDTLQLVVGLELSENCAHPIEVLNRIVLEGELGELGSLLQVFQDFVDESRVYGLIFYGVGSAS